ncbi:GntR family transcriptional regulator [Nocardioides sp. GXZ039]|uniref:GntR family transcriptional regulator n=1 Tax=Nocardioides sp. GXZ039 TaxID=3136018 RepID=UPI0030F3C610
MATPARLADAVFDRIRDEILAGQIKPGSKLSVPALADRLGVSRSPVREAVQRLTADRLAVDLPRRGCFVIELSGKELMPVYDVREVLEGLAARRAAEVADEGFREALSQHMSEHRKAVAEGDMDRHVVLDLEFHEMIHRSAGNDLLSEALSSISDVVQLATRQSAERRSTEEGRGRGEVAIVDHQLICDALLARDPDAAEAAARAHVARIRDHWHGAPR